MAFDGIPIANIVKDLQDNLIDGRLSKIAQPEPDELLCTIKGKNGQQRLCLSASASLPLIYLTRDNKPSPMTAPNFCMLLRKHIQGARVTDVAQVGSERIIEISLETLNELGFTVSKKLIFEIMGKHSNIVLLDISSGKIIDCIKHVSIDVNRVRQLLPGIIYKYPPAQDKIPFKELLPEGSPSVFLPPEAKAIQRTVGGVSPSFAQEMAASEDPLSFLRSAARIIEEGRFCPVVYSDDKGSPKEFHIIPLSEYEDVCQKKEFDSLSLCLEYYYAHKQSSNKLHQKASDLERSVSSQLDKLYLKEQRLREDLLKAENSESLRLYGELLTANIHQVRPGDKSTSVINYYDGSTVTIPLDPRLSPSKNAQQYFKKYGKAKTAVKEKQLQLRTNESDIKYLDSVMSYLKNASDVSEIEALRRELEETGYLRKRKIPGGFKEKKISSKPYRYILPGGCEVLVGRNNRENDILTFKTASSRDIWMHTKDIPGSHVIVKTSCEEISDEDLYTAASIAAYHSKGRESENVPVDYVRVKYVKKPAGAKPGMVIFTNNKTVWVDPKLPKAEEEQGSDHL